MALLIYYLAKGKPEQVTESFNETYRELEKIARTVYIMNNYAKIADTYGIEVLVGLIPAVGDGATSLVSFLTEMYQAGKAKLPVSDRLKILLDQAIDFGIGSIPIVGDIADFFYKSNTHAKDRFFSHFKNKITAAWQTGAISETDVSRLETISGVKIIMPSPKKEPASFSDNQADIPITAA